ncbi:hypothetical protein CYLTODRAFT_179534 [Cylindrobasidium torrendii FP15055 ss-10]|uniref:Uncharacterized protein n=1 Tax=Cylindrobasidium torrendii FP15055 ss-10 TaxID=1314674 RepID=A0A0D7BJB4_9AGAR|nr:hypothetical protein CYLTODRAFT_179534 [Cylindrobasidium torrendii FP15055 ss-10]
MLPPHAARLEVLASQDGLFPPRYSTRKQEVAFLTMSWGCVTVLNELQLAMTMSNKAQIDLCGALEVTPQEIAARITS